MQIDGDQSSNVEGRRSEGGGGFGGGGGGFGGGGFQIPMGGGGGGLFKGGFGLVAFVVIAMIMGADPGAILSDIAGGGGGTSSYTPAPPSSSASRTGTPAPAGDAESQFVSRVLKSTEDVWHEVFQDMGRQYRDPKLVLFRDATRTECGVGQAAMGQREMAPCEPTSAAKYRYFPSASKPRTFLASTNLGGCAPAATPFGSGALKIAEVVISGLLPTIAMFPAKNKVAPLIAR